HQRVPVFVFIYRSSMRDKLYGMRQCVRNPIFWTVSNPRETISSHRPLYLLVPLSIRKAFPPVEAGIVKPQLVLPLLFAWDTIALHQFLALLAALGAIPLDYQIVDHK